MKKGLKRIAGIVLALVMVVSLIPLASMTVKADDYTVIANKSGNTLTLEGTGELTSDSITNWYLMGYQTVSSYLSSNLTSNTKLVLKGFTSIGPSVFKDQTYITSVTFSDSVTIIYASAFEECDGLQSVVFPSNLYEIDSQAFYGCGALNNVEFKNKTSVHAIDTRAFVGASSSGTLTVTYEISNDTNIPTPISNWTKVVKSSVSFTTNSGNWASGYTAPTEYICGTGLTLPTSSDISRAGYTFDGWYTDESLSGSPVTSISASEGGDKTYYAKWTEQTATLSFDANGASSPAPSDITMKYTEATTLPAAMTWAGYSFGGWNTVADGSGTNYDAGATYKAANVVPSAATLYAQWTEKADQTITANDVNVNFGDTGKSISASTDAMGATLSYAIKTGYSADVVDVNSSTGALTIKKSGSTVVTVTSTETSAYKSATKDVNVTVSPGAMTVSASNGTATYNGSATNGGAAVSVSVPASGYTVAYGTATGTYDLSSIPTYTDAGTYTVYFKVTATDYSDYTGSFTISIAKADGSLTAPTAKTLICTGAAQELVNAGSSSTGTVQYKLGADGTYGTAIPTATAAGTYTVYYKVVGSSNYNDVAEASLDVTIGAATVSSIAMKSAPAKTSYAIGDTLDLTGATITATLSDSSTMDVDITSAMVSGFDSTSVGIKTVTVTYGGETTSFEISVFESHTITKTAPTNGTFKVMNGSDEITGAIKDTVITIATTPASGYVLDAVKYNDGTDHIVAKNGTDSCQFTMPDSAVTVTVTFKKVESGNVKVPDDKQKGNFSSGGLASSADDVKNAVLTDEDTAAIEAGKDVNVWVEMQDQTSTVSSEDKAAVEQKLPDSYGVGVYLDITLWKQVTGSDATKVSELPNGKVKISLTIPESLRKDGRTYKVIRLHNGTATVIDVTVDENYVLTFETDRFSTYAITYKDAAQNSDDGNNGGDNSGSVTPGTGDSNGLCFWLAILIAGLALAGWGISFRKWMKL